MDKTKIIIDYVWVDGQESQILRSKTRILYVDLRRYSDLNSYMGETPRVLTFSDFEKIPTWEFNGTFTEHNPKCTLKPVKLYKYLDGKYIVLCDTYDSLNEQPLSTNFRVRLKDLTKNLSETDFNVKQEFILLNSVKLKNNDYFCGLESYGSEVLEEFIKICLDLEIPIDEVYSTDHLGKWSYRLTDNNILTMADNLWISRFILYKVCNKLKEKVTFDSNKLASYGIAMKIYINYKGNELIFNTQNNPYKIFFDMI
jgi:glutamine synthetase